MNITKTLSIFIVAIFAISIVTAWHCVDTDAKQPASGFWGDNGFLNGITTGWSADGAAPAGCTGTQGNFVCNDRCDGTTLVEYYCGDWVHNVCTTQKVNVCKKDTVTDYDHFTWVGKGKDKHKVYGTKIVETCHKEDKQVCELGTDGETVIFSKNYLESSECNEVPEFGTLAAGVALIGGIAGVVIMRKKK
jgi:hypothetical protein